MHIARRYNGTWIAADGTIPFIMDGWIPPVGERNTTVNLPVNTGNIKPRMAENQKKTRSIGRKTAPVFFLIAFLTSHILTSCSAPEYSSRLDLTATAQTRNSSKTQVVLAGSPKTSGSDGLQDPMAVTTSTKKQPASTKTIAEIPQNTRIPENWLPHLRLSLPGQKLRLNYLPTNLDLPPTATLPVPTREPLFRLVCPLFHPLFHPLGAFNNNDDQKMVLYYSQAGDTRPAVAVRFGGTNI